MVQSLISVKKRILFILPHLSTGGLPQVAVKKIEMLKDTYSLFKGKKI
jgi:hypothetical protein